jgi:cytochrome c553
MCRRQERRALPVRAVTLLQAGLLAAGTLIPHLSVRGQPAQPKPVWMASDQPSYKIPSAGAIYLKRCARCHSRDGTGTDARDTMPTIPDFTSAGWQRKHSTAQLVASVLEGKGTQMPAFAGRLTGEDARRLAAHIRAFNPTYPTNSAAQATSDFETRFRELQEQLDRLRKQFQDLRGTQ